jgi:hypothetical protein
MSEPLDGAALLAEIKPQLREDATWIVLRPDLVDEFDAAEEALAESQGEDSQAPSRLASGGSSARTKKLAKRVRELEEEIQKTQVRFAFRAIPKTRYNEIVEAHPPREKNAWDAAVGHNREAVDNELVRVCLVDPVFTEAAWKELVAVINPGEWEELVRCVREVNGVRTQPPKSLLASAILDRPAAASRQRRDSE